MRREDADELYALLSDEAVMRWLEPPFNRAQAERFWSRRDFPSRRSSMPRRIWRENFSATPSTTTMMSTAGSSAGCSSLPFGTKGLCGRNEGPSDRACAAGGEGCRDRMRPRNRPRAHIARRHGFFHMRAARTAVTFTACAVKNKKRALPKLGKRPLLCCFLLCADG